jgi:histidine triad (HIT) family protein
MPPCVFCDIVAGRAPAQIIYQDEHVTAFHDLHPQAPVHILIVPNRHIVSCAELAAGDEALLGHLLVKAAQLAAQENVASGFRLVCNTGRPAGQSVYHLHLHVLGGRVFGWPPG